MADFVAVLKKTIDGMGDTTPEVRARVYDKARSTIAAKLAAVVPPPSEAVAERQKRTLEEAIATVEKGYAKPAPTPAQAVDPLAELENIFSSIDRNRNQPSHVRPAPRIEPAWQRPVAEARKTPEPAPLPAPAPSFTPVAEKRLDRDAARSVEPKTASRDEEFSPYAGAGAETDVFEPVGPVEPARRGRGGLVAAVVALLVVAGGAYGIWLNAGAFKSMFGGKAGSETVKEEPLASAKPAVATAPATQAGTPANASTDAGEAPKFTQRLTSEGKETDPGPAGGEATVGEGTSVVALTTPPPAQGATPPVEAQPAATPPATDGAAAPAAGTTAPAASPSALAVGQKAIFYEERTSSAQGSAEPGNIVWSLVQESPGGDAPPEPAIRAEVTIPGKDVQLRMTIHRNTDDTLPASHIIELIFLTPDAFEGGGIDNILRVAMKPAEQDAGSPLIGIPAKIADGFFLVALNDTKADEQTNLTLLRNQGWIDIPVIYKSGRRALLTMEKGIPGEKVFDDAMKAWQAKTAG